MRLDLACGQNPHEGFIGVDLYALNAIRVDLFKFPYPWEDNSVDEIYCSHFVEHLPNRDIELRDTIHERLPDNSIFLAKDFLFAFFDECYRILVPEGKMTVIVPALQSVRAFQDPTHRRFICGETFAYLSKKWRTMNGLDHYRVSCDFHPVIQSITIGQENTTSEDLMSHWNKVLDWEATLVKI